MEISFILQWVGYFGIGLAGEKFYRIRKIKGQKELTLDYLPKRRKMNWRDRLFQIQKSTGKDIHHKLFKMVKNEADCMTKSAYYTYCRGLVGIID